jgi:hypothetical protein
MTLDYTVPRKQVIYVPNYTVSVSALPYFKYYKVCTESNLYRRYVSLGTSCKHKAEWSHGATYSCPLNKVGWDSVVNITADLHSDVVCWAWGNSDTVMWFDQNR